MATPEPRRRLELSGQGRLDVNTMLQDRTRASQPTAATTLASGLAWGLSGGLAGTLVMDIVLMGALLVMGMPALTCFAIVGRTIAHFLALPGFVLTGDVSLGVTAHYVIGPLVGVAFGAVVARVKMCRDGALLRIIVLAVLYVEIFSLPLLALSPILLRWTAIETLQWFGGSTVMHLLLGAVLGLVVGYGLRPTTPTAL